MKKIFFIVFLSVCIFAFCDAYKITFKGSYGFNIFARTLLSASNEEYIVGGDTTNTNDAILAKLNYKGEIIWAKVFGGEQLDMVRLVLTVDGNFLLLANTFSTDTGSPDVLLFLINGNGEILKQKKLGDDGYDFGISIIQVSNGGFVMLGYKIFSYNKYFWIAKLNSNLEIEWERIIGSPGSNILPRDVVETGTGYILIGYEDYFSSYDYSYAVKIDTSGNLLWQKKYSAQDSYFNMEDIVFDDLNCSIVAIERDHSTYIANIKIDPNGTPIYSRFYSGNFDAPQTNSIREADGSIVISSAYNPEVFIAKFNSNYDLLWAKHYIDEPVNLYTAIQKCQDDGYAFLGRANGNWGFNIFKADNLGEIGKECQAAENITLPEIGKIISAENSNLNVSNISSTYIDTNITFYEFQVSYSICYPNLQLAISANPINGNAPLSVMFTSNVKGGIPPYFYDWDFGDETAHSSQANPNHIYQKVGVYHPYLKVWDSNNPPAEAIAEPLTIAVFSIGINLLLDPKEGTTAGGTIMHIYGKQKAFEQGASVYFDLSNTCPQEPKTTIISEGVQYINSSHLQVKTPRAYEGPVSIYIDNPTIEDICQTSAYAFKTLAYTANLAGNSNVIDTVEDNLFEVSNSIDFLGDRYLTSITFSKNSDSERKIYLTDYETGNLLKADSSNFKFLNEIILQNQNLTYYGLGAEDVAVDSRGNVYVVHTTSGIEEPPPICIPPDEPCPDYPWNPEPGGISLIDKAGNLVDIDNNPLTTTQGAPLGITRIETPQFYPYSISILNLQRDQKYYQPMDGYPGEYAFVSGVGPQPPKPIKYQCICKKGNFIEHLLSCMEECPSGWRKIMLPIFAPRPLRIGIIDLNKYIVEDISRGVLGLNPNYRKYIGGINPGTDGQMLGISDQGIDFNVLPNNQDAVVYTVNPYEDKVYYFNFLEAVRNPSGFSFNEIQLQCFDDAGNQIQCGPTDVKVQKVLTQTGYQTYAYITNAQDDSVTVIDTATNMEVPLYSPIEQSQCNAEIWHSPTSFDTRSSGEKGYSTDINSNTVSVYDLPMSRMSDPCQIDVDLGPREIVVAHVNTWEDIFGMVKDLLKVADLEDFTEGPKQDNLVREWENVKDLIETNASDQAIIAKVEAFRTHINNWVKNQELKEAINSGIDTFKASYKVNKK